jgi:nicotinamide riboside transporter PnuC
MIASVVTVINIVSFLVGQYLVTRRNGLGFFIWAGSNLMVVVLNIANGSFATACMFIVYCLANLCSVGVWFKEKGEGRGVPSTSPGGSTPVARSA